MYVKATRRQESCRVNFPLQAVFHELLQYSLHSYNLILKDISAASILLYSILFLSKKANCVEIFTQFYTVTYPCFAGEIWLALMVRNGVTGLLISTYLLCVLHNYMINMFGRSILA